MRAVFATLAIVTAMGCSEGPAGAPSSTSRQQPAADRVHASSPDEEMSPLRAPPSAPRERTLRVGVGSAQTANAIRKYEALAQWLASAAGLDAGELVAEEHTQTSIGELCAGNVDLLLATPYTAARAETACGAVMLLVAAKHDLLRYRSAIVVRNDSPIRTLEGLSGATILFEDTGSTSAYAIPRAMIEQAGLRMIPEDHAPGTGEVRMRFVGNELNIIGGVVHGRAAAGALSSDDLGGYEGADVRVIAESALVPRQLVVARPGLDRALTLRLVHASCVDGDGARANALTLAEIGRFDRVNASDDAAVHAVRAAMLDGEAR